MNVLLQKRYSAPQSYRPSLGSPRCRDDGLAFLLENWANCSEPLPLISFALAFFLSPQTCLPFSNSAFWQSDHPTGTLSSGLAADFADRVFRVAFFLVEDLQRVAPVTCFVLCWNAA